MPEETKKESKKDSEPGFLTPEQVAAHSATSEADEPPTDNGQSDRPAKSTKTNRFERFKWHNLSKKEKIIAIVVIVVILIAAGGVAWALTHRHKTPPPKTVHHLVVTKPVSTTVPSTLTGLPVDPSVNKRPVTGVMIENSLPARPQSGLDQAGVVFEAIAEAGITRFLALYQDTQPTYLGPVRSARPYYVQWCMGFDCALGHVGGSPEALQDISTWGVRDMNQFYNSSAYERISSRYAPHNVYTSAAQLNALEASKGFTSSQFSGFPRKKDSPAKTPNASSITINPSYYDYMSQYAYSQKANDYTRSEGGQPHIEINQAGIQTPITPKVVIAMVMQQGIEADNYHTTYNVVGSGQAFVFQDGTVTVGTWQKTSNTGQVTFTDSSGKPIRLNAGQTWLVAVKSASLVTYK